MLYLILGLLAIIAIILIAASAKPNTAHYERSTVINASPEKIVPHLIDFHKWEAWSPWDKLEPGMKRNYSGAASGVGAKYAWEGKKKAGVGNMEITEVTASQVKLDLNFIKPWESRCVTVFRMVNEAQGTRLSWVMDGPNIFMGKVFGLFMNMDKLIGKDFEKGLEALKVEVEKG